MAKTFQTVNTPFGYMSFTPDVPPQALKPNEYNSGQNIQTNVRGMATINGDQEILSQVPGTTIFVSSGFRDNDVFWFVVCSLDADNHMHWYALDGGGITEVTPLTGFINTYNSTTTIITDCWNGNVLFINDNVNPPMYLLPGEGHFRIYDHGPDNYVWNYYGGAGGLPLWSSYTAGWMRLFATPNVGSILIAGNLTAQLPNGTTQYYPTTVQWSQAFGLNSGPTTWAPTITNTANQLEIPVRGPVIDGFPCNGNFYCCSYWDTVIFSPIQYQSTSAPILGVKLLNQGRGLLNENCWSNADQVVYGLDARDIWVFDGSNFKSLGNQRVKNYFYSNLNPAYSNRVFTVNNTALNQFEIYYPDLTSTGWCNKMLSYRYDLDIFNAPRDVTSASHGVESPRWTGTTNNYATRCVVYANAGGTNKQLIQKDTGTTFINNEPIQANFRRDNITFGEPYSNQVMIHRILPQVTGTGNVNITVGGALSVGATPSLQGTITMPIDTTSPWIQCNQNDYRVVTVEISSDNTTSNQWNMTGIDWQLTIVEDSR